MKRPRKPKPQEINSLFEKILVEHIATSELRDLYRQQFNDSLRAYGIEKYMSGSHDCYTGGIEAIKKYFINQH